MSIFSLDYWCSYWSGQHSSSNSLFSLFFSLNMHLAQYGGLLIASEIPSCWEQKTKKNIFPQSQETMLGKDFQTELVSATWKAALSLALTDNDKVWALSLLLVRKIQHLRCRCTRSNTLDVHIPEKENVIFFQVLPWRPLESMLSISK